MVLFFKGSYANYNKSFLDTLDPFNVKCSIWRSFIKGSQLMPLFLITSFSVLTGLKAVSIFSSYFNELISKTKF